jgi:anti-sigma factor ChrR (cupin superfamily)
MTDDRVPPDSGEDAEVLGLAAAAGAPARAPAPELRDRIMRELVERPFTFLTAGEGIWLPSPNASVATRLLFWDSADHAATRLVRLAAGHALPPAMLGGVRTLYVTAGVIHTAGGTLEQGDFTEEARPVQEWRARRPSTVLETSISRPETFGLRLVVASQAVWRALSPGIRASTLVSAHDAGREVLLIRAEPEAVLQGHDHEGVEELFVLQGSCVIEDQPLEAGDYHRAAGGSQHHPARTGAEGCLLYCSVRDSSRFVA